MGSSTSSPVPACTPGRELPALLMLVMALLSAPASRGITQEPVDVVFRVGRVYTGAGKVLSPGMVHLRAGRIVAVEESLEIPAGATVHDLPAHVLIPGLVDAETSLTGEATDLDRSVAPEVLALDGWDFFADRRELLRGGVTTVYVAPGIAQGGRPTRLVSGRGCVVKTGGAAGDPRSRVLAGASGIQVTLGELSKRPPSIYDPPTAASPDNPFQTIPLQLPQSRPGELLLLREVLGKAREAAAAPSDGSPGPASPSIEAAALVPLVRGTDHLRVRANRARDILHVLRLARAERLTLVLEGAREADRLTAELAQLKVPVVFAGGFVPGLIPGGDLTLETTEGRYREQTLISLIQGGIKVALHSPTDAQVGDLLLQAESAVRAGLDPDPALRSITSWAAEILGVSGRVGSLAPGKDADLVLLGGDPFSAAGKVQAVFVEGELVFHDGPKGLDSRHTIVRTRSIHNGKGDTIPGGIVVFEGKKITYVGPGPLTAQLSPGAKILDASREVVVPGFIDCGTSAGARAESLVVEGAAGSGSLGGAGRATFRLADAVDPRDPTFAELRGQGITTIALAPEPIAPVSGQVSVWKLNGGTREEATLRSFAGLLLRTDLPPQELKKAREYHDRWKAYEAKPQGEAPERKEELEPFRALFEQRALAFLFAGNIEGVAGPGKSLTAEQGLRVIPLGPGRADRAAEELRRAGLPVLLGAPFVVEEERTRVNIPRRTSELGLRLAFRSGAATGAGGLISQVTFAVTQGWSREEALAALTSRAAELLGVEDRVGSLEVGKDADLVFLSGEPLAPGTRVTRVIVEGAQR